MREVGDIDASKPRVMQTRAWRCGKAAPAGHWASGESLRAVAYLDGSSESIVTHPTVHDASPAHAPSCRTHAGHDDIIEAQCPLGRCHKARVREHACSSRQHLTATVAMGSLFPKGSRVPPRVWDCFLFPKGLGESDPPTFWDRSATLLCSGHCERVFCRSRVLLHGEPPSGARLSSAAGHEPF